MTFNIVRQINGKRDMVDTNSKCFVDNTVSMGKNVQLGHYVTIHEHVKIGKND